MKNTTPWHKAPTQAARAKQLAGHVHELRKGPLATWRRDVLHRMRLYSGRWKVRTDGTCTDASTRFNLARMCVDTAVSVLCASRTLPFCQTRGAEWEIRRKAMRRTRALQTQFNRIGVFDQSLPVMVDACVTGLGVLHIAEDEDRGGLVGVEREHPLSYVWDPMEAILGLPRLECLHRLVDRAQLAELYPSKASVIAKAPGADEMDRVDFELANGGHGCDLVAVDEAWVLPATKGGSGLHCIAVANGMLFEEEWKDSRSQLALLRGWQPAQMGLPGTSVCELVEEAQRRCDELREFVTECQHLASGPIGILNGGGLAELQQEELTNAPFKFYRNMGDRDPTFFTFAGTPPDLQQQYQMIREETLAMLGLNALQTSGQKPAGLDSGAAIRSYAAEGSKRHVLMLRHLEAYYLSVSERICDANDRLAERAPGFVVERETRSRWLATSKWTELSIDEGEASLAVLPVSALTGTVANQQETLANWINRGWIDESTAKQLENHPDTEADAEEEDGAAELAHDQVDAIMDGQEVGIDPLIPPTTYLEVFLPAYYRAVRQGADQATLDQLRNILDQSKQAADSAAAAMQPPAPPPGAAPMPQ